MKLKIGTVPSCKLCGGDIFNLIQRDLKNEKRNYQAFGQ